jgi:ribose transport system ATP-binding protein
MTKPSYPRAPAPAGAPVSFAIRDVSMDFGAGPVLDRVSLEMRQSEVHGLIGENGSGKSTLIKILAGFHVPTAGTLTVAGRDVPLPLAPAQFRDLGMHFVHQDLGLVPSLTVTENLFVDSVARARPFRVVSPGTWRARAAETLHSFGLGDLAPDTLVSDLTPTESARLAIVRAVHEMRESASSRGESRGLLVLDEPTVFLPREGREQLYELVRDVAFHHASVLFVSHDLDEVRTLTDRVTVLRDGRVAATFATADVAERELVSALIGNDLQAFRGEARPSIRGVTPALAVRGISGESVSKVDLTVYPGEILGVTGLLGSGFDALPYLVAGAAPAVEGEVQIGEATFGAGAITPKVALKAGLAFIPGDRKRLGSAPGLTVEENMMLLSVGDFARTGVVQRPALRSEARRLADAFDVRPRDTGFLYGSLSGGNQQKALLAKWLQRRPSVLLVHEPTQGVDIGARQQIFELLDAAAAQGTAIVCASSDNEQLAQLCHRVVVLSNGHISDELTGEGVDKHRISESVYRRRGSHDVPAPLAGPSERTL